MEVGLRCHISEVLHREDSCNQSSDCFKDRGWGAGCCRAACRALGFLHLGDHWCLMGLLMAVTFCTCLPVVPCWPVVLEGLAGSRQSSLQQLCEQALIALALPWRPLLDAHFLSEKVHFLQSSGGAHKKDFFHMARPCFLLIQLLLGLVEMLPAPPSPTVPSLFVGCLGSRWEMMWAWGCDSLLQLLHCL